MAEEHNDKNDGDEIAGDFVDMYGYLMHYPGTELDACSSLKAFAEHYAHALIDEGLVRCLADLLLAWLTYGDATRYCPTYDIYLRVVICTVALWNGENKQQGIDELYAEPGSAFPRREPDPRAGEYGVVLEFVTRLDSHVTVIEHPAFAQGTYEAARIERSLAHWGDHEALAAFRTRPS
ncbi:hypothetical protein ACO03V_06015 [Microbacterium sp. HMH0099]|uniref:hypothetical protein n=1 Tax=Microbacterium sp. HMH0099 TaxID=3414026 RepID=UPI003BF6FFBB